MRNANIDDVKRAVATGMLEENVMYSMNGLRVHGKKTSYMVSHYMLQKGEALVECAEGVLYKALIAAHIQPILSGESQKPKRIKRKPVRGTKPEKLIEMSADVKLEVGDRVLLENGMRVEITVVDMTDTQYPYYSSYWYDRTGKVTFAEGLYYEGENITHKIIPWHKQNHLYVNGKLIGQVKDLKITMEGKSSHNVSITLGDNTLSVDCWHTLGREGTMYRSNGDPGDPPEPDEIEIERIKIGQEDVTELLATLWVEKRGTITRDIRYVPVWSVLEEKALEKIYDQR